MKAEENSKNFILVMLSLVILLGGFLRFFQLDKYPVHLGHDEISQLYDAISIVQTGKDIYKEPLPFIFQSVNDFKPPFYTYATLVSYLFFGWQEITVRIPGAIFGTLLIIAVYFFVKKLLKNEGLALLSALLTAISPFEIFYSRKSFEHQAGLFFTLVGFTFLLSYLDTKSKKLLYLTALFIGLSVYAYFSQAVLFPLLLLTFFILYVRKFKGVDIKPVVLLVLIITPLYYQVFINPDTRSRSSSVFITQDLRLGEDLKDNRNDLENFVDIGIYSFVRYMSQFSPRYLFFEGLSLTDGRWDVGPIFVTGIPLLIIGIWVLLREKKLGKERILLVVWLLIGMIPSGLTFEDYSPHRALMSFTLLNVIMAIGIFWIYKKWGRVSLILIVLFLGLNLGFFIKRYTLNFPIEKSEALHYPFKQVSLFAWDNYDKYDQIIFDPKFGEFAPWIGTGAHYYLAFYGNYPPDKMQREFGVGDQNKRETKFDKFSIRAVFWPEDINLKRTLIIASRWSLPEDIEKTANIIKIFYYRTTAPAFYAIEL